MMREQNFKPERPTFQVVTRRPSQARTHALNDGANEAVRPPNTRWWKRLERLSLILGLTGLSVTSLIAGIENYLDKMQAVETLQATIVQLESRLARLEETNDRLENELNFIKGKLERPRAATSSFDEKGLAQNKIMAFTPINEQPETAPQQHAPARTEAAQSVDPRAPLHVIDKLNMTINYAYRKARAGNPNLAGRLLVKCRIDERGNLDKSEVLALNAELEEVAANVRDKVRRWNFPNTVTGLEEGPYERIYFLTPSSF